MEAEKDDGQMLDNEIASIVGRLQRHMEFLIVNVTGSNQIKLAWIRAAISSLQGYLIVQNPPRHWEDILENKEEELGELS